MSKVSHCPTPPNPSPNPGSKRPCSQARPPYPPFPPFPPFPPPFPSLPFPSLPPPILPPSTYLPIYLPPSTYPSTYLPIYLSIYLSTYLTIYLSTYLPNPPGPPPGRCTNSRFPYPSQGLFSSLSSPQALPNPSRAFFFFFFFYANQAGLEPVTSLSPLCLPISYLFSSYANCAIPARLKIQWFFSMLFICKSNSRPSLALENNDVMNLRPRGPAVQRSKNQNKPKFAKRNGNCSLLGFGKDPLRALKKTLTP